MSNSIKKYREAAGLKQIDLAKKLNVAPNTVWRWECGERTPHWSDIQAMCQLFGCTSDELMSSNPTPSPAAENRQGTAETAQ